MVLLSESPTALEQEMVMALTECLTSASVVNDAVSRYSCSQISYTYWFVPVPFVTLSQISCLILILVSTFLILNAACSLAYFLWGQALFSDICVTSDASITLKSLQWIQKVPLLAKMLSSDFK